VNALLHVQHVSRHYGGLAAVNRVSLTLPAGARRALIGPNGAGKTTLLNLIAGDMLATEGTIRFAGRDLTRARPAVRARAGISRTFQAPALWASTTAVEHLVVAAMPHQPKRIFIGPRRYGHLNRLAWERLSNLGLNALGHVPANQLSHGQQRLLEIGVALAGEPRLLLLDEPAAGLVDADLDRLVTLLNRLPDTMALLLVEHNLDVVSAVARTVTVLHEGRVVTTGTPADISSDPEVRDVYLGTLTVGG
jgi:branched-chain amino acid transport system ATP-binding protein